MLSYAYFSYTLLQGGSGEASAGPRSRVGTIGVTARVPGASRNRGPGVHDRPAPRAGRQGLCAAQRQSQHRVHRSRLTGSARHAELPSRARCPGCGGVRSQPVRRRLPAVGHARILQLGARAVERHLRLGLAQPGRSDSAHPFPAGDQRRSGNSRGCSAYSDFRELLDKERGVDAVVVCTTDNLHAAVSAAAMKKKKHVFCQKPLTHTIYEARQIAQLARETGVATQIAVGNQPSEDPRRLCKWIWRGAIGPVREVVNWSSRPFWPQGLDRPQSAEPVPDGLDWDLWLGPAPERPFNHAYAPFVWRGWADFGCGALGDMGCYSYDTIFRVLKLEAPLSVEASSTDRYAE